MKRPVADIQANAFQRSSSLFIRLDRAGNHTAVNLTSLQRTRKSARSTFQLAGEFTARRSNLAGKLAVLSINGAVENAVLGIDIATEISLAVIGVDVEVRALRNLQTLQCDIIIEHNLAVLVDKRRGNCRAVRCIQVSLAGGNAVARVD